LVLESDRLHERARYIELELGSGTVANAHGCLLPVALQGSEKEVFS